ncbi:MAG: hypothetical protein RR831_01125 [Stenotrophomonas sp.]
MATLDRINQKFGRRMAGLVASGWQARPAWACGSTCSPQTTRPRSTSFPAHAADMVHLMPRGLQTHCFDGVYLHQHPLANP